MRFGISEISWMLPKILRMRRGLDFAPLEVLWGASIALVAMCFPAPVRERTPASAPLVYPCERRDPVLGTCVDLLVDCVSAGAQLSWSASSRLLLPNACGPCAVRTLSRGGQEKPRAHVTVRRSRYFVDEAD